MGAKLVVAREPFIPAVYLCSESFLLGIPLLLLYSSVILHSVNPEAFTIPQRYSPEERQQLRRNNVIYVYLLHIM